MHREQLNKHWDIIEEFKNGAEIQRFVLDIAEFVDDDYPDFSTHTKYRIKPKPLELWVNTYRYGIDNNYSTKEEAKLKSKNAVRIAVHMKEVEE